MDVGDEDDDFEIFDYPCFHDDARLCGRCEVLMERMLRRAIELRLRDTDKFWPEGIVQKLRLVQNRKIEALVKETRRPPEPPMSPFPDCDLCKEPGAIVTPDGCAYCADCWRATEPYRVKYLGHKAKEN